MPDDLDNVDPRAVRLEQGGSAQSDAWKHTLEDMETLEAERREEGWDVVSLFSLQTDTVSKDMGDDPEYFGLAHIIPNNRAEEIEEWFDPDEFSEYLVYGTAVGGYMFAVIEFIDPERERSIMLACRYDMVRSDGLATSARDEGVLYSHFKLVDGTIIGTFPHEEFEPLITKPGE